MSHGACLSSEIGDILKIFEVAHLHICFVFLNGWKQILGTSPQRIRLFKYCMTASKGELINLKKCNSIAIIKTQDKTKIIDTFMTTFNVIHIYVVTLLSIKSLFEHVCYLGPCVGESSMITSDPMFVSDTHCSAIHVHRGQLRDGLGPSKVNSILII